MVKKEFTYDEVDAMCERLENLEYQCGDWWPSMSEVKNNLEPAMKSRVPNALEFAIWITSTANDPVTPEEAEVKTYLLKIINKYLKIKET